MRYRIALDIGGTFTDFVVQDLKRQRVLFWKTSTTPDDLTRGVLDGLARIGQRETLSVSEVEEILHATTIAANAIIERKGSRTGLITTEGFRDVLIIGRQKRYELYDLHLDKPVPLVPRRYSVEVRERVAYTGEVLVQLDMESVTRAVARLLAEGIESIAVSLLHAYANPAHERTIAAEIHRMAPHLSVSLSSEVSPRYREYERTSTTVADAYVKPVVRRYVSTLQDTLERHGFRGTFLIMQSNGGLSTPNLVAEHPIRIVESGPAAGVLMAALVGREVGCDDLITFDMGGTTAKLGVITEGQPATVPTFEIASVSYRRGSGLPLNIPAIELLEIGAGGGSIARSTSMGLIQVGPESAGAEPGPLCYGRGADMPTVTDADLVLGYLNPAYFLGGAMGLDLEAAAQGIERQIASPLGLSIGDAAWGIHAIANANMERAMRVISIERGRDPRRFALVAFGGAGPLHATRLARALGIPRVVVPKGAGVGSAIGLLASDMKFDVSVTRIVSLAPEQSDSIAAIYRELEQHAIALIHRIQNGAQPCWSRYAHMRYAGQGYETRVDLPIGQITPDYVMQAQETFRAVYKRAHGYTHPQASIEVVDWYLVATLPSILAPLGAPVDTEVRSGNPCKGDRKAYFPESGGYITCPVMDRYLLPSGQVVRGPAIIEERESTTVILPGDVASVDEHGHLVVTIEGA